ncbi:CpsB/CapC family capsule biosynthesis tyrosine phosphatase [Clostridium sardiniense]|uniref:CpsB/CapC family capsule biosynthesis tyrosine phosphatase n=1 Tax=Clostridium sardiniense TaxID=29369 RepID=UPI003D33F6B8
MGNVVNLKELDLINLYAPKNIKINDKNLDINRYKVLEIEGYYPSNIFKDIYDIQLKGYIPIVLYPEKLIPIIDNISDINDFIDSDCLFVLDAKSLEGDYGRAIKNTSKVLLENKIYNFINKNRVSEDDISTVISKYKGYDEILEESIEKLNNGELIEFSGRRVKPKKKLLGIF